MKNMASGDKNDWDALNNALSPDDRDYVDLLNDSLAMVDDPRRIDLAAVCYQRALAAAKLGEWQVAITEFDRAIALKPDWLEAYYERGLAHLKVQDNRSD
jgi:tetratricopeptide (TPR) repeat protein